MSPMLAVLLVALLATYVDPAAPAGSSGEEGFGSQDGVPDSSPELLSGDDACLAGGADGEAACALSVLQRRSRTLAQLHESAELGTGSGGGGSAGGSGSSRGTSAATRTVAAVNRSQGRARSPESEDCENDTGGTCYFFGCDRSRGETQCENWKCLCKEGYCQSGGVCRKSSFAGCPRHTGGSCQFLPCDASRGPAQCIESHCTCPEGLCADNGACALPEGTLTAEVLRITESGTEPKGYPWEVSTALCFSGGGSRSLSIVMGALRALEALGLMSSVDAISSVSGGSWASAIYMFADMSIEELLGAAAQPAALTLSALRREPPAMGRTALTDTAKLALSLIAGGTASDDLWDEVIAHSFLAPFGLNSKVSFMASSEADAERIKAANPVLKDNVFLTPRPGRPRVFVMNAALEAPVGFLASNKNVVSFQMSPDFVGSPLRPKDGPVTYSTNGGDGDGSGVEVGGGLVEAFAFGGAAPLTGQGGSTHATMRVPRLPFTLAKAVGISSAAFASQLTSSKFAPSSVVPKASIWPVLPSANSVPTAARTYTLGDGGNVENGGLLAMLQRRAQRVIWWMNTDTGISRKLDFCSTGSLSDDQAAHASSNQLYDKFGYGKLASEFLANNQVFAKEDFPVLLCEFQKLIRAGKPAVVRKTMAVQPNSWWGIVGYHVDLVFVYNEHCEEFVSALPADTRGSLAKGTGGDFANFPFYKTTFNNALGATSLTAAQVNLLAAQSEYVVRQNEAMIRDVLSAKYTRVVVR